MSLLPRICRWNVVKTVINCATIFPKPSQRERLAQVCEKFTLESLYGRIELIKDVKGPSLDCQ
jgi:hypothetical protein